MVAATRLAVAGPAALAFALLRRKRLAALASSIERIRQRMSARSKLASAVAMAVIASDEDAQPRRVVTRALGKWRGSTVQGYIRAGDEVTYLLNFRCTQDRLVTASSTSLGCFRNQSSIFAQKVKVLH